MYEESDRLNKRLVGDEKGRLSKYTEKEPKPNAIAQITPNSQKSIKQVFSTRPKETACLDLLANSSPLYLGNDQAKISHTGVLDLHLTPKQLGSEDTDSFQ